MKEISHIEKYLRQEMTETERKVFEAKLAKDSALQAEYLLHLTLFEALQKGKEQENAHKSAAKEWVNSLENQAKKPVLMPLWTRYAAAACFVFLLCGAAYYFFQHSQKQEANWVKNREQSKDSSSALVSEDTNRREIRKENEIDTTSQETVSLPKPINKAKKIDNSEEIAILQQIIDTKKEIRRYQDSIDVVASKKMIGFSGTKTKKTQWQTENDLLLLYKNKEKMPSSSEIQLWQKQRLTCWEELAATKQMWNKYKNK